MVDQITAVRRGVLKLVSDHQATRGTGVSTECTVATLGHVDVEPGQIQPLLGMGFIGGHTQIHVRGGLDGFDVDAIHRAGRRTLLAADTVVDIVMQFAPEIFLGGGFHIWIEYRVGLLVHVEQGDFHPLVKGDQTIHHILQVFTHHSSPF